MCQSKIKNEIMMFVCVVFISVMGISGNAAALIMEMSLEELSSGADSIVVGRVVNRKSLWNREKTDIYTRIVISAEDHLKGSATPRNIAIAVPGGKIGDTIVEVTDVPDFSVGEKVVVFIRSITDKEISEHGLVNMGADTPWFRVHGGFQGKFSVMEDKVGHLPLIKFKERIHNALKGEFLAPPESENMLNSAPVSPVPTISGITPSLASAGTNTLITIQGSHFGDLPGVPNFYYKSNGYYSCAACVSSWTDFEVVAGVPIFKSASGYSASAGSGPIYLTTSAGERSSPFPFTVTFSYGGIKWTDFRPEVEFKVGPNGNEAFLKAVQDAADTWNAVPNKSFSFKYAGEAPSDKTAMNQTNEIIWANLQDGVIGQATLRSSGGILRECDIKFNTKYKWSTDASTPYGAMDVHTVALHEMGHWLNLRDLYGNVPGYPTDMDKIMYGFGGYGVQKRNLTLYDSLGMQYIYPGKNPCAASLSLFNSAYHLLVPIVNTSPNLWVDLQHEPALTTSMMFWLSNTGEATNSDGYAACQPSTLSLTDNDYKLHIAELIFDGISYRVELTHVPTTDGLIWFVLSGVWPN